MPGQLKKVLYLEDDPSISEIVLVALQEFADYDVNHHADGNSVVGAYDNFAPDLMLFDVMVPGLDGVKAYEAISERHGGKTVPVIFMTAKAQSHEQESYLAAGAIGVITKPFDALSLGDQVAELFSLARKM